MSPNPEKSNPSALHLLDEANPVLTMGGVPKLAKKQWLTMAAIGGVHFSSAICISLQAPFYPQEAEKKGATATEYGLVFGVFELVSFLTSPFLGKYIDTIGVKTVLNIGMVIAAIAAMLFGMLDLVMSHNWFISLSFLLRIIESLGSTAALVAAFSITAAAFPRAIGTTFATLEIFYGVGYIVGPTIGGVLFTLGGYKLPFLINGLAMLLIAIAIKVLLPPIYTETTDDQPQETIMSYLRIPAVLLNSSCVVATAISMGYYSATLEPHLRMFNLSPIAMGLTFVVSGGTYACIAPLVGRICDRWVYPKRVTSIGCLLIMTSFTIVGPAPYIPLPTTLPLCITGLVIQGFGLACTMVPTFMDSICSAVSAGFSDDINTYGILSGVWTASFSLGAFVGPSVAGLLYDWVGFRWGTLFVITIHGSLFIVCNCFIAFEKQKSLPAHRVRMLSERLENETDTSESESLEDKNLPSNMLLGWDKDSLGTRNGGYGAISNKPVEVLSY